MASPSSDGADLPDDIANRMSLFYANPTLMLNTLSGATSKLLQELQCGCVGVGVYWGMMETLLQEVQCGSICWGEGGVAVERECQCSSK